MFTSFHLTLVEDRKIVKPDTSIEKFIIFLDKLFFNLPDKLIFETSEMEEYVKDFLGMQNEKIDAVYSVHHPMFKADEDALHIGTALHTAFALKSLEELTN